MRRSIVKDTIILTAVQMLLDGAGLLVNVLLTRWLGASGVGVLTLTGAFFRLACMIAGGNAFLCVSRFVSEELGKPVRDPGKVLGICIGVSLMLSLVCCVLLRIFAKSAAEYFLHDAALGDAIRLLALVLPAVTLAACLKGWHNALCKAGICAAADGLEFLLRSGVMLLLAFLRHPTDAGALCRLTAWSALISAAGEILLLLLCMPAARAGRTGTASLGLKRYLRLAIPVMAGSALTSLLSAANDALVPVTLRQSGAGVEEALADFGLFEAIILPALFFPSTILCALAGILVTESARARAAGNRSRIIALSRKTISQTLCFAVFVTLVLFRSGARLGEVLGGGAQAGTMIRLLAPVVPFIYLEIVLESIIKGLGEQGFSSFNYLAEYAIRIGIVLLCIPLMGFPGLVLSYYASNIAGNLARMILVCKKTGMRFEWWEMLGKPLFAAVFSDQMSRMLFLLIGVQAEGNAAALLLYLLLCGLGYLWVIHALTFPTKSVIMEV